MCWTKPRRFLGRRLQHRGEGFHNRQVLPEGSRRIHSKLDVADRRPCDCYYCDHLDHISGCALALMLSFASLGCALAAAMTLQPCGDGLLGGSWYFVTTFNCTYICTYNHIRALKGLTSGHKSSIQAPSGWEGAVKLIAAPLSHCLACEPIEIFLNNPPRVTYGLTKTNHYL